MKWEQYSSQNAPKITKFEKVDSPFEITEATYITDSKFENIKNNAAIYTNSSKSILIERTVFRSCTNLGDGAALHLVIKNSASFGLIQSLFDGCSCINSNSFGNTFNVDGDKQKNIVHFENCVLLNSFSSSTDEFSIWHCQAIVTSINSSYNSLDGNAGSSICFRSTNIQRYCIYSHITSKEYISFSDNEVDRMFRCIFENNDSRGAVVYNCFNNKYVTSCIFRNTGRVIFDTKKNSTITSSDCSFDVAVSNSSNVKIDSINNFLVEGKIIPSNASCVHDAIVRNLFGLYFQFLLAGVLSMFTEN